MTVLVTGATGYLGKYIIQELESREIPYKAVSRSAQQDQNFVECDILDPTTFNTLFSGIDTVIHAAGLVSHENEDSDQLWKIHVDGTKNVLQAALDNQVKRVVYLSTSGTIAVSIEDEISDEKALSPLGLIKSWPYYRSKYFAEQIALEFVQKGLPLICLNPSLLLGPGDGQDGNSTKPVRLFLEDKIPVAPSGGVSFADVRDVAKTVVDALQIGTIGQRYLLSSANMTFLEFYQKLARLANKPTPIMKMPSFTRKALNWFPKINKVGMHLDRHDVELASYYWYADPSKAEKDLAWKSRDPIDTLFDTVEDITKLQNDFSWFD